MTEPDPELEALEAELSETNIPWVEELVLDHIVQRYALHHLHNVLYVEPRPQHPIGEDEHQYEGHVITRITKAATDAGWSRQRGLPDSLLDEGPFLRFNLPG